MAERIPGARFVAVARGGHTLTHLDPTVRRAVEQFLDAAYASAPIPAVPREVDENMGAYLFFFVCTSLWLASAGALAARLAGTASPSARHVACATWASRRSRRSRRARVARSWSRFAW
jgi:hypothetical protein